MHAPLQPLLRRPAFWGLVALACAALSLALLRARGPAVRVALLKSQPLEQHVVASGRVMPPARISVAANLGGLVLAVGAVEGQHVAKGDLLVQIDDAEANAQVAQARAAVQQAGARVEQLRRVGAIVATQALREAQSNEEKAAVALSRARQLSASGTLPQSQLEDAVRAVEIAQAQRRTAEAQQLASSPLGADSRVSLAALLQARAQLAAQEAKLRQTRLVAAQSGVVLNRLVEAGDMVQPGRTLLSMAADGAVELTFQPDERNLAVLALGQKARASADAFPQDVFDAVVDWIAPSIDPQRGTVEVRLRVDKPPAFLRPDMTVSVDVTVARREQALVLPSQAVHGLATAAPFVLAVEAGRVARRPVSLGLRGEGAVEIATGLSAGAEAVVADGQRLEPGQRVRASVE
jgi:HlyD family secretion protein